MLCRKFELILTKTYITNFGNKIMNYTYFSIIGSKIASNFNDIFMLPYKV